MTDLVLTIALYCAVVRVLATIILAKAAFSMNRLGDGAPTLDLFR
jgi:hypothetical protein